MNFTVCPSRAARAFTRRHIELGTSRRMYEVVSAMCVIIHLLSEDVKLIMSGIPRQGYAGMIMTIRQFRLDKMRWEGSLSLSGFHTNTPQKERAPGSGNPRRSVPSRLSLHGTVASKATSILVYPAAPSNQSPAMTRYRTLGRFQLRAEKLPHSEDSGCKSGLDPKMHGEVRCTGHLRAPSSHLSCKMTALVSIVSFLFQGRDERKKVSCCL